jgi:hypothetical protein
MGGFERLESIGTNRSRVRGSERVVHRCLEDERVGLGLKELDRGELE